MNKIHHVQLSNFKLLHTAKELAKLLKSDTDIFPPNIEFSFIK